MKKIGHEITQDELEEIMKKHDVDKNGSISFIEFKALLLDEDQSLKVLEKM